MNDLTEKWKKGELPSRDDEHEWLSYYIKHNDGYIHADSYWRGKWGIADRNSIVEVLAPVPTYQEYLESEAHCAVYSDENKQLKELLKDCRQQLQEVELYRYDVDDIDQEDWFRISTEQAGIANKMKTKIDEVLK